MAFSFEATHGTTFLFNKGISGNVTIIRGTEQLSVLPRRLSPSTK